jgi:CRISPR-associated endonuclease/helicase Cas3
VQLGGIGRLLACCIAAHHAGLPDNVGGESSLSARLEESTEPIDAAPAGLLDSGKPAVPRLVLATNRGFSLASLTRMPFSALVDADFLDTECAMSPWRADRRPGDAVTCAMLPDRLDVHLGAIPLNVHSWDPRG